MASRHASAPKHTDTSRCTKHAKERTRRNCSSYNGRWWSLKRVSIAAPAGTHDDGAATASLTVGPMFGSGATYRPRQGCVRLTIRVTLVGSTALKTPARPLPCKTCADGSPELQESMDPNGERCYERTRQRAPKPPKGETPSGMEALVSQQPSTTQCSTDGCRTSSHSVVDSLQARQATAAERATT